MEHRRDTAPAEGCSGGVIERNQVIRGYGDILHQTDAGTSPASTSFNGLIEDFDTTIDFGAGDGKRWGDTPDRRHCPDRNDVHGQA